MGTATPCRNRPNLPTLRLAMNINGATQAALQAVQSADATDGMRAQLQVALLKKSLQSQEAQAAEMLKMLSGKGQQIDLRV